MNPKIIFLANLLLWGASLSFGGTDPIKASLPEQILAIEAAFNQQSALIREIQALVQANQEREMQARKREAEQQRIREIEAEQQQIRDLAAQIEAEEQRIREIKAEQQQIRDLAAQIEAEKQRIREIKAEQQRIRDLAAQIEAEEQRIRDARLRFKVRTGGAIIILIIAGILTGYL